MDLLNTAKPIYFKGYAGDNRENNYTLETHSAEYI